MPYLLLSDASQEPDNGLDTNSRREVDMTDDKKKKHDDKDRKKLSDEELEDVAGGGGGGGAKPSHSTDLRDDFAK